MAISENEFKKERLILKKVNKLLNDTIDSLGVRVSQDELNLVEFRYIKNPTKKHVGLIYQEAKEIFVKNYWIFIHKLL